jgi:hypothetical protein
VIFSKEIVSCVCTSGDRGGGESEGRVSRIESAVKSAIKSASKCRRVVVDAGTTTGTNTVATKDTRCWVVVEVAGSAKGQLETPGIIVSVSAVGIGIGIRGRGGLESPGIIVFVSAVGIGVRVRDRDRIRCEMAAAEELAALLVLVLVLVLGRNRGQEKDDSKGREAHYSLFLVRLFWIFKQR